MSTAPMVPATSGADGSLTSRLVTDPRIIGPSDPLIATLARYVEALHRRYPAGPEQMHREGLDGRANITGMDSPKKDTAA